MNKKTTIAISTAVIVALVTGLVILPENSESQEQKPVAYFGPPVAITKVIVQQQVDSIEEAASVVGYEVKTPALPATYAVQYIAVDKDIGVVTLLASPNEVKRDITTLDDFFDDQKGILIFMEKQNSAFDKVSSLAGWVLQHNADSIMVGSNEGAVHEIVTTNRFDQPIQQPAQLIFHKDDVLVKLRGMVSSSELISVAESLA